MNADMGERGPSVLARTRVALGLLAGLRGHDFHAAWTFMHMTWPHDAAPVRLLKFAGWTLRQMFSIIPDALATVSFANRPSKVSLWQDAPNPLANHPWATHPDARLPDDVDVAVIGAGFTGAACAYH